MIAELLCTAFRIPKIIMVIFYACCSIVYTVIFWLSNNNNKAIKNLFEVLLNAFNKSYVSSGKFLQYWFFVYNNFFRFRLIFERNIFCNVKFCFLVLFNYISICAFLRNKKRNQRISIFLRYFVQFDFNYMVLAVSYENYKWLWVVIPPVKVMQGHCL